MSAAMSSDVDGHDGREPPPEREPAEHAEVGRGRLDRDLGAGALVAGAQQQGERDEGREQRRAAVAHEGQRDAGQRDEPRDAADDDERLQRDRRDEADRGERRHVGLRARSGREAADREHEEAQHDRRRAEQPELLADRREDEVGRDERDARGQPLPEPDADQPARREREERLHELVALARGVGERVEPDVDARPHVAEEEVRDGRAGTEQREPDDHVGRAPGRRVEHHEEDREEQQRGAEVALEDEHDERDDPHEQQRAERARLGQAHAEDAARRDREHLAVLGEVGGEEEHDEDLGELAGLEAEAAEADPQLGAVDLAADERRQQQQHEAADHERVLVAREALERGHADERGDERRHADEEPHHLGRGELRRRAA